MLYLCKTFPSKNNGSTEEEFFETIIHKQTSSTSLRIIYIMYSVFRKNKNRQLND